MMVLSAVRKTTLGLTCKREIGENLSGAAFCESSEEKKGSVAKLPTPFCSIQHVAILILGKLTMEYDPKISRQNLLGAHALLQAQVDPLQVRISPRSNLCRNSPAVRGARMLACASNFWVPGSPRSTSRSLRHSPPKSRL